MRKINLFTPFSIMILIFVLNSCKGAQEGGPVKMKTEKSAAAPAPSSSTSSTDDFNYEVEFVED